MRSARLGDGLKLVKGQIEYSDEDIHCVAVEVRSSRLVIRSGAFVTAKEVKGNKLWLEVVKNHVGGEPEIGFYLTDMEEFAIFSVFRRGSDP
jgi:hypothetical protein